MGPRLAEPSKEFSCHLVSRVCVLYALRSASNYTCLPLSKGRLYPVNALLPVLSLRMPHTCLFTARDNTACELHLMENQPKVPFQSYSLSSHIHRKLYHCICIASKFASYWICQTCFVKTAVSPLQFGTTEEPPPAGMLASTL